MSDFRQELLAAFAVEHREHLDAIRAALAAAEAGRPLDLRDIFRRAHSLKGAARAVDLPAVEELAHRLETLFSRLGEGRMPLDARAQAVAQQGLDAVETQVAAHLAAAPEEDGPPPPSAALAALDALLGAAAPDAPAEAHGAPPAAPRPGPAEEGGEKEAAPAATPGTSTSGTSPPAPAERHPVAGGGEYLRVEAGRVDALSGLLHELSGELQNQDRQAEALRRLERRLRGLRRTWQELRGEAGKANGGGAEARLREFDLALSGLGRDLAALVRDGRDAAWNADQLSRRLRQGVERISLVPAEAVLGGLGSMTRDLARSEGREIALRLEGMETEADRRVLQALKDPVLHLLRNAVGHGGAPWASRNAARSGCASNWAADGCGCASSTTAPGRTRSASRPRRCARACCPPAAPRPHPRPRTASSPWSSSPASPPPRRWGGCRGAAWACRWWRRRRGRCTAMR